MTGDDVLQLVLERCRQRIAEAREKAWEEGRRHGEQNFISCPDDNPYRNGDEEGA